ncbi:uncharacterized protein Tco025E_07896 [Trypanosoma conorhini]|uniref:Paraquat-inducible protein A n=1 Tax=Trypanosoma conorhini TaxID=83891 RepID=A0A3R7NDL8_9TRYP|nr:uncharacterized protein Tco025E_07896 [Trypanosoma conorhini]RNF04884.1 hypothetical protein Tco025E_07896 [Trypanosoma conorhini]
MSAGCLSLLFWWSSITLANLSLPEFSVDVPSMGTVSNLSCAAIGIGATNWTLNSTYWSAATTELSDVKCSVQLDPFFSSSRLFGHAQLPPVHLTATKSVDDTCHNNGAVLDQCIFNVSVQSLLLQPPDEIVQSVLDDLIGTIGDQVSQGICVAGLPPFLGQLKNQTVYPPAPPPPLVEGATPLGDLALARGVVKAINKAPAFLGIQTNASILAGTTLRLGLTFTNGVHLKFDGPAALKDSLEKVEGLFAMMGLQEAFNDITQHLPVVENGFVELNIPQTFHLSAEVAFNDFRCDKHGENCSVPISNGVTVQNIRVENLGEYDHIVINNLGPLLSQLLGKMLGYMMSYGVVKDSRAYLPDVKKSEYSTTPSTPLLVSMIVIGVALILATAAMSVWRYRRNVVTTREGDPISLKRVLLEDTALMTMTVLAAIGFTWSNVTTAASLFLGEDFPLMSFSLMDSTRNMYRARVYVFAVLVFAFSGVYPYIKLVFIVICTLFLQKPELVALRLVDYFGKFSFLDSCGMLLMVSGLQLEGVASVELHPGFYFFLAATALSIFIGNYATTIWRRNTSLRKKGMLKGPVACDVPEAQPNERDEGKQRNWWAMLWSKDMLLRLANTTFIFVCVILCWVVPCVRYTVKGMASVIMPEDRSMTLWEISVTNIFFLIVCIFTILIAPVLYALMYPRWYVLASWSAADALLLACVAGLYQIEQFVRYMLGDKMRDIYGAGATLLWPLIPLLISAVWQWVLAAEHTFKLRRHVRQWLAARKASQSSEPL